MSDINRAGDFYFVQWYSVEEFKKAYRLIYGPDSNEENKKEALQMFLVWKARCPVLPVGLESTLGLLEVDLQKPVGNKESSVPSRLLRLMYSSVIMRFINHMLDDAQSKKLSLLQAARQVNIPQWIINLRHETAHGHELPSLNLLQNAAHFAMNWLFENYWEPQNKLLSNYSTGFQSENYKHVEDKLSHLINLHNLLAVLCCPSFDIKKISDIPDDDMRESLLVDLKSINISKTLKSIENSNINAVRKLAIKAINLTLIKYKSFSKKDEIFARLMLDEESLFLVDEINFPNTTNKDNGKLSQQYIVMWEPILRLMHSHNMISALFHKLLDIVQCEKEPPVKRLRVAQWIKEISIGLVKSKLFQHLMQERKIEIREMNNKGLVNILHHHFPNQKSGLIFDLLEPIPQEVSSIDYMYEVYKHAHPYLNIYAKEVLQLLERPLPDSSRDELLALVGIVCIKTCKESTCENIYTLRDVMKSKGMDVDEYSTDNNLEGNMSSDPTDISQTLSRVDSGMETGKWQRASADFDWGKCPIGVLPWQVNSTENPLLPTI